MADRFAWPAPSTSESATPTRDFQKISGNQLVKKGFDKLVDGEASSPATATLTSFC